MHDYESAILRVTRLTTGHGLVCVCTHRSSCELKPIIIHEKPAAIFIPTSGRPSDCRRQTGRRHRHRQASAAAARLYPRATQVVMPPPASRCACACEHGCLLCWARACIAMHMIGTRRSRPVWSLLACLSSEPPVAPASPRAHGHPHFQNSPMSPSPEKPGPPQRSEQTVETDVGTPGVSRQRAAASLPGHCLEVALFGVWILLQEESLVEVIFCVFAREGVGFNNRVTRVSLAQ